TQIATGRTMGRAKRKRAKPTERTPDPLVVLAAEGSTAVDDLLRQVATHGAANVNEMLRQIAADGPLDRLFAGLADAGPVNRPPPAGHRPKSAGNVSEADGARPRAVE